MKSIATCLSILILSFHCLFAQNHKLIRIPVLKPNNKIDSLMALIYRADSVERKSDKSYLKGSCLILSFGKKGEYSIAVGAISTIEKDANRSINDWIAVRDNWGYFKFKQFKVFVRLSEDFSDCFYKTQNVTTFRFIYRLKPDNDYLPTLEKTSFWSFDYRDGNFVLYSHRLRVD